MENFPHPPHCGCLSNFKNSKNNDVQKFKDYLWDILCVNMYCLLPEILRNFIYYINSNLDMDIIIPKWAYFGHSPDTLKELNIKWSIHKILKESYKENPIIFVDEVKEIEDIDFILNQKLNKIKKQIIEATENPLDIFHGKASYQRFFIECLLFAGKLASQYIATFKNEKNIIFEKVIERLHMFFQEQNLYAWIEHNAQVLEPFGKHKFCDSSEDSSEDEELEEEMD